MPDQLPAVGSRLIVGKHAATIRYIGNVQSQEGLWAGLEWDDPSRGKHDGSHNGKRYFTCQRHPESGSFVRLTKLVDSGADFGQTFASALQTRYKDYSTSVSAQDNRGGDIRGEDDKHAEDVPYASTVSNRKVPIRLVGSAQTAAMLSQDGALRTASCIEMRISDLTVNSNTLSFLRNVNVLDISSNLIARWCEVVTLACALPSLRTLNLSKNALDIDIEVSMDDMHKTCTTLETIVLNGCGLRNWERVVALTQSFPALTALHLCNNGISTLLPLSAMGRKLELPKTIELIDLEDNTLDDWKGVEEALGLPLPNLTSLLLSGNNIPSITAPPSPDCFTNLQSLMLGDNKIHDWSSIGNLNRFPRLVDVRLSQNPLPVPLMDTSGGGGSYSSSLRYEIIARMSKIKVLNGAEVRHGERQDAEIAYLRRASMANTNTSNYDDDDALRTFLIAKYGDMHANTEMSVGGVLPPPRTTSTHDTTLNNTMVELIFMVNNSNNNDNNNNNNNGNNKGVVIVKEDQSTPPHGEGRILRKKVPSTLTVGRLKPLLERILRLRIGTQSVTLFDSNDRFVEDLSRQDGRELKFYGVENGWKVCVGERDVQEERTVAALLHERKMEEHERGLQRLRAEEERLMVGSTVGSHSL